MGEGNMGHLKPNTCDTFLRVVGWVVMCEPFGQVTLGWLQEVRRERGPPQAMASSGLCFTGRCLSQPRGLHRIFPEISSAVHIASLYF